MADFSPARRDRIIALLRSWDDWCHVPGSRAGWLSQAGERDEHTGKQSGAVCPECGKASAERGRLCDTCWGIMSRQNASELRRLEVEAAARAGTLGEDDRRRLVSQKERHYRTGSYQAVEDAMRQLRKRQPYSYFVLTRRYVDELGVAFVVDEARLTASLRALSDLLPDLLRVSEGLLPAEDKDERDRRIIAWSAAGRSTRWIAGRTGITQPRVVQILSKHRLSRAAAA